MNLYYHLELSNLLEFPEIEVDIIDLCIVMFISNHYSKSEGRNMRGKGYLVLHKKKWWVKVKTEYLINSNPYLKLIDGKTLTSRLKSLEMYGFIEWEKDLSKKLGISCYRVGYLCKMLMSSESLTEIDKKNIRTHIRNSKIPKNSKKVTT